MKTSLAGFACVVLFVSSGFAVDIRAPIYKAPPPIDPWSGLYAGFNVGYSSGPWHSTSNQAVFPVTSLTAGPRVNGVLGGIQVGLNMRGNGPWLIGFEADLQRTRERATQSSSDPGVDVPPGTSDFVGRCCGPATLDHAWEFPWFATLRLRAGMTPTENWLLYVTGGLAYGETRYSFNFSQPGAALVFPPVATDYALSIRSSQWGYTLGAGTELKLDRNWSVKLEYLLVDLGKVSIDRPDIDGAPFHVDYSVRDHILRIGLNYQLWNLRP